jgi:steroid delta-isomerase-like uncharacterized protein
MSEENKALAHRVFEEVFNGGNLQAMDELYAPNYVHHDPSLPPEMQQDLDAYKQVIAMFHGAFDSVSVTVEDEIAEGDKVANRWAFRGTHTGELMGITPTGNRVEFSAISIHRIADGRFAEGWVNFDALGMMQQLGVIPASGQAEEANPT